MSMPNWTPGPWVAMNGNQDIYTNLGAPSGDGSLADKDDGWHIAIVSDHGALCGGDQTSLGERVLRANADLISKAPSMADALAQWQASETMGDEQELQNARNERDRILAKLAGGE